MYISKLFYFGSPTFLHFLAWNVPFILMIDFSDAEVVTYYITSHKEC